MADVARTIGLPVALLFAAAIVRDARLFTLPVLVAGYVVARSGHLPAAPAWAATLPVALSLAWGVASQPAGAADLSDCANVASPPALWRLGEAVVALAALGVVARSLGATRLELGLRRPSRPELLISGFGFLGAAGVGVLAGSALARPFFGSFSLDFGRPGALVPALLFAGSNGLMEELVYRGSLRAWIARSAGSTAAIGIQAVVFGLAHAGPDVVGSALPIVAAMAAGGAIAGAIVRRTGSLAVPIALHVAFDLPLYYYWACRMA